MKACPTVAGLRARGRCCVSTQLPFQPLHCQTYENEWHKCWRHIRLLSALLQRVLIVQLWVQICYGSKPLKLTQLDSGYGILRNHCQVVTEKFSVPKVSVHVLAQMACNTRLRPPILSFGGQASSQVAPFCPHWLAARTPSSASSLNS
jgi:hypothetical protein